MITPFSVDFASLHIETLVPMLITIVGALTILCIDLLNKTLDKSLYIMLTIVFLVISLGSIVGYNSDVRGFFDIMMIDGISILAQVIILVLSCAFILLAFSKQRVHEYQYPEYFALYLFMIAGFQFMVSSDSLIMIFVGLETSSMAIYTIIAMHNRKNAIEAAIKYFTMGALASAFFAFGAMIFYAITGTVELGKISEILVNSHFDNYPVILIGVAMMIGALGFKMSLVPFHSWVPDVYQGSTSALAGFIAVVPKMAGFVVVLRFFEIFIQANDPYVHAVLYGIVVLTMTLGNLMALSQTDIKRMLGFSSISHAGFVMAAILIGSTQATTGLFLYWALFAVANIGAFAMLWLYRTKQDSIFSSDHNTLEKYAGLVKRSPMMATLMALFMLSLAGIPPFSLFWGKFYLLGSAINEGYIYLALIMALNSAIAVYYYVKPVVYMFFKEPADHCNIEFLTNSTTALRVVIGFFAIVTIASIAMVEPLIEYISYYVQISGY